MKYIDSAIAVIALVPKLTSWNKHGSNVGENFGYLYFRQSKLILL